MREIIHIHIPKTGGNWLHDQLKKHLPEHYHTLDPNGIVHVSMNLTSCLPIHRGSKYAITHRVVGPYSFPSITWPKASRVDKAWKVSICRNPFDQLVSMYHHDDCQGLGMMNKIHRFTSFEDFIKHFCDPDFPFTERLDTMRYFLYNQMFNDRGVCAANVIIRNEYLHEAASKMIARWKGAPVKLDDKRTNVSKLRKKKDYRSYYTNELRELVEQKCAAELFLFGYGFDGPLDEAWCINPHMLFYHPGIPVAGKWLPKKMIDLHTDLIGDAQTREWWDDVPYLQYITPDIFAYHRDGGVIMYTGNKGDPKPMVEVCQSLGIPIGEFKDPAYFYEPEAWGQ